MTTLVSARGIFAVQLTTIKVGPGSRISSLHFTFFLLFLLFSSSLAAPPAGIQSDSDPKRSSACRFSAGCCHGSVQSDLLYPSLLKKTRAPSGRPPFAFSRSPLDSLLAGFLFFFLILDVAPLHKWPPHPWDWQVAMVLEESLVSFFSPPFSLLLKSVWVAFWRHYSLFSPFLPPCAAPFSQVHLGRILHALEIIFALPTHWVPLTVSLVSHLLDNFSTVVWLGLATCWRRTSERTLSVGSLHACLLFHAVSPSPGLVKLPRALQSTGMR